MRFILRGDDYPFWPKVNAEEFSAAERRLDGSATDVVACFPDGYTASCVPRSSASLVWERFCRKPDGAVRSLLAALARLGYMERIGR